MILLYEKKNFKIVKINSEYFYHNRDYIIQQFHDISNSNDMEETIDLDYVFSKNFSNSVICAIINNRIISYVVARKLNNFWHIDFIKTHHDFQKNGIGKQVLLMCINDILCQNGEKISYLPNEKSNNLFNSIVLEREDLEQVNEQLGRKSIVKKISR